MRAVGYVRVSSDQQVDNYSIPAQRREVEEFCSAKGWSLTAIYSEEGFSARSESLDKRPEIKRLLQDCKKGLFDVVVVHSLDRWSRNQLVTLQTFKLLGQHSVAFTSITENIDYSTPEGTLFLSLLGGFSQYFSDSLARHTSKGIKQRAVSGLHNGSAPFGYIKCDCCEATLHTDPKESEAVRKMFELYASGSWSLRRIAGWLNDQGFRTRNTKRMQGPDGSVVSGPRRFTIASVRWILHNSFFTGKVKHNGDEYPGLHDPVVDESLFEVVQQRMKHARSRNHTVSTKYRFYTLKGLARCVHCGLPLWAETTTKGHAYYREQAGTRAYEGCRSQGKVIRCDVVDDQVGELMRNIALQSTWKKKVLARLTAESEYVTATRERQQVQDRLRRLGKAYVDNLVSESEYELEKRILDARLENLTLPEVEATFDAASLIENLSALWEKATPEERRKILLGMLDAVYLDLGEGTGVVGISPKPVFRALFESSDGKEDTKLRVLTKQRPGSGESGRNSEDGLLWWRRGRDGLLLEHDLSVLQGAA